MPITPQYVIQFEKVEMSERDPRIMYLAKGEEYMCLGRKLFRSLSLNIEI